MAVAARTVGSESPSHAADKADESLGEFCRLLVVSAVALDGCVAPSTDIANGGVRHSEVEALEKDGGDSPVGEVRVGLDGGEDGLTPKLLFELVSPSTAQ